MSGISMLAVRHDNDDDIYLYMCVYIYIYMCVYVVREQSFILSCFIKL